MYFTILQDFVTLQRWEHQGTVDLKLNIEKSQRKLVKCRRQVSFAVQEMVTPVFAGLASSLGIHHVQAVAAKAHQFVEVLSGPDSTDPSTAILSNTVPVHPYQIAADTKYDPRQMTEAMAAVAEKWMHQSCSCISGKLPHLASASFHHCLFRSGHELLFGMPYQAYRVYDTSVSNR